MASPEPAPSADLPTLCPYCDSVELDFTYLLSPKPELPAMLVFACRSCGSHVESYAGELDPPVDDPRWIIAATPPDRTAVSRPLADAP